MFRVNRITLATLLVLSFIFYGCTYTVVAPTATTVEIHTSYDEKIPGNWAIIVDESSTNFETEVDVDGSGCLAYSFIFNPGESVRLSSIDAFQKVFEHTTQMKRVPSHEEMKRGNLIGNAVVELEGFDSEIVCRTKLVSVKCTVEVEIEFDIVVQGIDGKLLGATVDSRKIVRDGDGIGLTCEGISELYSKAYSLALGDSLEEMAEEISNSIRIRDYAKKQIQGGGSDKRN